MRFIPLRFCAAGALILFCAALSDTRAWAESSFRIGTDWRSWTYETRSGDVTLSQLQLPVSATHRRGLWTTEVGLAFVSNESDVAGVGTASLSGLGRARIRVQRRWREGRLWTFAEARHSSLVAEVSPDELLLVEILERPELSLPFDAADFGGQLRGGFLAQLVRRPDFLLQAGTEFRWRNSYELREDGLEVTPGNEFRFGLSADHEFRGTVWRHGLWRDLFGVHEIDGSPAYSSGSHWRWQSMVHKRWGAFATGAEVGLLWSEDGELKTDRFLDGSSLRSGNRLVTGIWISRPNPGWTWSASLRTTQFRGFAGSLGHSSRFTPGFGIARPLGRGRLQLNADLVFGTLREEEALSGFGLNLGWSLPGGGP